MVGLGPGNRTRDFGVLLETVFAYTRFRRPTFQARSQAGTRDRVPVRTTVTPICLWGKSIENTIVLPVNGYPDMTPDDLFYKKQPQTPLIELILFSIIF